jgi:uncharacterized protein (DUF302 family)
MIRSFTLMLALALASPLVHAEPTGPASIQVGPPAIYRVPVSKGVSLEDAVESMKLRANALNIKLVAEQPLSKQVEVMVGKPQRTMAIYQFCDALTAKELVDFNMEFSVFLPCRIAAIEDSSGQGWLMMMDVDVEALAKANKLPAALKDKIKGVRDGLVQIVQAGAKGEL